MRFHRFITLIIAIGYISSQSISTESWSNLIQDLSLKVHNEKPIESHPLNEGFMLMSENHPKPSKKPDNRIFKPNSTLSTTCRTVVIVKTNKQTSPPPIVDHSVGHLGRRLLNEPNHDIDTEELNNFMKVDDEELSKQLLSMEMAMDGSGDSTTTTTTTTTTATTPTPSERIVLPNNTRFLLEVNCYNATNTTDEILNELKIRFSNHVILARIDAQCNNATLPKISRQKRQADLTAGLANASIEILTDNSPEVLNGLYENLKEIAANRNVELFSDVCGNNETVRVVNVTSCYVIDKCYLCGTNPPRGFCIPSYHEIKCECIPNRNDPSRPYEGQFCYTPDPSVSKPSPDWTPVIVGVVAGVVALIAMVTFCLWVMAIWRPSAKGAPTVRRIWHLPRAQIPIPVTSENIQDPSNNTFSTSSSRRTNSDYNRSVSTDSTFFKELDQRMGENLRATITRPNTSGMLASLPADTSSTLSNYDPIDELDAIIDNEDTTTFHDPLNELFDDPDILEAINPNLQVPQPNVNSKPTGLFSYFYNNS